uniref:Sushi domain-containing protein n=1 Tax=Oreochromis aureus TaxID=47969 RepID=A0A668V4T8_OREAU
MLIGQSKTSWPSSYKIWTDFRFVFCPQDCSRPVGDNMDLKGNDILLTSFPDGTTVTFACNIGYVYAGGSPSVTCTAGSWSPVRLKCQRYNCGPVHEVENGQIEYHPGTEFGDKAVLICNPGHMPLGGGELTCGSQGWMGRLPVCEGWLSCLNTIEYGSFSPNKDIYEYNEVLQYTCKKDYTLVGSRQLICLEDGIFKPEPPRCISKSQDCSRPVGENMDLKGNDILLTSFPDGTTVTFACNTGYESAGGSPSVTCTAGSWSPVGFTCCSVSCKIKIPKPVFSSNQLYATWWRRTHLWKPRVVGQVACM